MCFRSMGHPWPVPRPVTLGILPLVRLILRVREAFRYYRVVTSGLHTVLERIAPGKDAGRHMGGPKALAVLAGPALPLSAKIVCNPIGAA